jgi:cyclopropane-fatty-acyl-phospholipid synthase
MNTNTTSAPVISSTQAMPAAARRVVSLLQRLQHGTLHVQWPDGRVEQFGSANGEGLNATCICTALRR